MSEDDPALPVVIDQGVIEQDPVELLRIERRRERVRALRALRPVERAFLRQLPKSRYAPYTAGIAIGISSRTVHTMLNRARVRHVMEMLLAEALDEIGVSHVSLVADLVEIKERCMQAHPVIGKDGQPTGEWQSDYRAAIMAVKELSELLKLAPPKRIELSGTIQTTNKTVTIQTDDPLEASRLYQDMIQGK